MELLTELFLYQKKAVDKLIKLKVGALYMEQGTGKTRTALEMIKIRLDKGRITKVLWLCPCSVKNNLRRDIVKHTGSENADIIKICGIETLSSSERTFDELIEYVDDQTFMIIDESILIKTYKSIRTQRIIELSKKCKYKIIMNGTPISVNQGDLFSQWYALDWRILGYRTRYSFCANHFEYDQRTNRLRNCLNTDYLTDKISPYTYEIKKKDCLQLPQKRYYYRYYEMSEEQQEHYYDVYYKFMMQVDELRSDTIYRFFTALQDVIAGLEVKEVDEHIVTSRFFKTPEDNPRIKKLMNMVDDSEKTIIFAKYTHEIEDIIVVLEKLYGKGCAVKFDGSVSVKDRDNNLVKFENDPKVKFFVANPKCGAYGLNLQFCHNIIFYSIDFNITNRLQAEDRVHRIGQEHDIDIGFIVCESSLDEFIVKNLDKKESLISALLEEIKNNNQLEYEKFINYIKSDEHLD